MYLIVLTYILSKDGVESTMIRTRTPNGKASIRASNGRLQVRIRYEGQSYCLSLRMDDDAKGRQKALEIASAIDVDVSLGRFNPDDLEAYLPKHLRKTSVPTPRKQLKTIQELWINYVDNNQGNFAESTKLTSILTLSNKLQSYPRYIIGKDEQKLIAQFSHLSVVTQNSQLGKLKTAYRWGEKNNLISKGLSDLIIVPALESEDIAPPDPLEDYEINALLDECINCDQIDLLYLIKFLLYTGCRPNEAFGLRVSSVNLKTKQICFQQTRNKVRGKVIEKEGTKTKRKRYFPINEQLMDLINEIFTNENNVKSEYLLTYKGKPWDSHQLSNLWRGRDRKGKPMTDGLVTRLAKEGRIARYKTPYNLRDTYITHCINKGIAPHVIALWVGNSPAMIDKHYFGVLDSITSPSLYS